MRVSEADLRGVLIRLFRAVDDGDVSLTHWPREDPLGEVYGLECPEDDTCDCPSKKLFEDIQVIADALGITAAEIEAEP